MTYEKQGLVYEGKAKKIYELNKKGYLIQFFKDDVTAFNNKKKDVIFNKGVVNNAISAYVMSYLNDNKIVTHFIEKINEREQLIKKLNIIPVEFIVRNITAGSIVRRLGVKEGLKLSKPLQEYCYKNDDLGDPMTSENEIIEFSWCSSAVLSQINIVVLQVNDLLQKLFKSVNIELVDFKLEFGLNDKQEVVLADEVTPDSCRLWDIGTNRKLDKDLFRLQLGNTIEAYYEVANRFNIDYL